MKGLHVISGNLIIVSLLVLITSRILDWYNPFMDFGGHTVFMVYVLVGAAAAFVFSGVWLMPGKHKKGFKQSIGHRKCSEL